MSYTAGQICTNALTEINAIASGDTPDPADLLWVLQKLNDQLDEWSARRLYVPSKTFQIFTLQSGLSPHTIGPSGATFAWNQAPVDIDGAALILPSGAVVDVPMRKRDAAWWQQQRTKAIETSVPTDFYYQSDQPNGSIFFWPVPNINDQVRLELRQLLNQLAGLGTTFTLWPGYRQAITLTLAEAIASSFEKQVTPTLARNAMLARKAIGENNAKSPRITTADFGMPEAGRRRGRRSDFNWETGNLT